jgi:ABC-type bacteriocin/lantibiotic exporter with double-glycine peptidase domain
MRCLRYYTDVEQEQPYDRPADDNPSLDNWPANAAVTFTDVCARYRPGLPLVVAHLSFTVRAGEKVRLSCYI